MTLEDRITDLAEAVAGDVVEIHALIQQRAKVSDLAPVATSGSYRDLTDRPLQEFFADPPAEPGDMWLLKDVVEDESTAFYGAMPLTYEGEYNFRLSVQTSQGVRRTQLI